MRIKLMKIHLKERTAARLMNAASLNGFEVSSWRAEPGSVVFKVYRRDDPNGDAATAAFKAAWKETFKPSRTTQA